MNNENVRNGEYFLECCSDDDLFVCGKCQSQFRDVKIFMDHKNSFCITSYPPMKSQLHSQVRMTSLGSSEQPTYHNGDYYTEEMNGGFYEASTNINYLYNDGNTPKNNINGSYVSFIDDGKYDQMAFLQNRNGHQMQFSHDLNDDCINKSNYFNEVTITQQKATIFDDVSNNEINYEIYPMATQVFNVGEGGFIDQCNGNIMKTPLNNVDFGYPSIMTHNGNYINDVDTAGTNSCLYNYDTNKMMLTSAKNGIEIVDIDNNNYGNSFPNVGNNHTQTIFAMPSFKAELLKDPMNIMNVSSNVNVPDLSKEVFKDKEYNVDNKESSENNCELIIVEPRTNVNKITKKYECDYCLKVFFRYSNLEQHLRLHTGEKPFQCPICGRKFSQKSNAKKHIKSHKVWINSEDASLPKFHTIGVQLKDKRHIIVRPSKSVSPIINRKQFHLLTNIKNRSMFGVSTDNNNPVILVNNSFECSFCKQKFQSYQKLRSHSIVHKDLQVYLCVFADCKQTFEDLDMFLQHLEDHKKEENIKFNCQFCCTLFTTLYELMCHYKEHDESNGNLSSKCHKCHKQIQNPQLNRNKITGNSNTYLCSHCNTTFKSQKVFKNHTTNFKLYHNFICPICSKGFSAEIYLSRHVRSLHKSSTILFKCKQCDKVFRTMSSLRYHRTSQHRILPHPDCKVNHYEHKKYFSTNNDCQCFPTTNKQLKRKKVTVKNIPIVPIAESQTDINLKQNYEEDGMVCFYCGKLYRRRLPFESHVLMCKQKEAEKERKESYKNQRFGDLKPQITVEINTLESDRTTRRAKFKKTWTVKLSRKKSSLKTDLVVHEPFVKEIKQTLPSISILNKSYELPIESNLNSYDTESFSFLKSLEFNS